MNCFGSNGPYAPLSQPLMSAQAPVPHASGPTAPLSPLKDGLFATGLAPGLAPGLPATLQTGRPATPPGSSSSRKHAPRELPYKVMPSRVHKKRDMPASPPRIVKPLDVALRNVHDTTPPPVPVDDPNGYYIAEKGATFGDRYTIYRQLGQGTFGKVLEAWDSQMSRFVAIKIIRAIPKYRSASRNELRALVALNNYDPANTSQCVRMLECFDYRNHVCIVTELLDISIYDFLKRNSFAPFPGWQVRSFAQQLLRSVRYLHSLGLVHTDLKPENILLRDASYTQDTWKRTPRSGSRTRRVLKDTSVSLIDFGSAIFDDEYHAAVVSTRHYRAPEIILGTGWSTPCDMWSVGCVLVELCTGAVLFQTRDNATHLHMMEATTRQEFSRDILRAAASNSTGAEFVLASRLAPITDAKGLQTIQRHQPLRQVVRETGAYADDPLFWTQFLDLIEQMLCLDPAKRITAQQALAHPWVQGR